MRKVSLGRPLATTLAGKVDWILHALHEIELASAVKDPEFDSYTATLTATAVYDPPNLAPNNSVNTTVIVPGAAMTDAAAATFSIPPGDIVIRAAVSAPDEVTVNFLNPTAGAENLGEGTIKVIVFRM